MAGSIVEQDDLDLALMAGVHETPPLATFMERLLTRMHARHALLMLSPGEATAAAEPEVFNFAATRARSEIPLDISLLKALGLPPSVSLRRDRVYAIEELLDYDRPDVLARQRDALAAMGARYGRWLRVSAGADAEADIFVTRDDADFSSAAVAALASTIPYLKAALHLVATFEEERLHRRAAQAALGRLGIGQLVLDENAAVLAADAVAEAALAFVVGRGGRRLQLPVSAEEVLIRACREIASHHDPHAPPMCLAITDRLALLLEPAPSERRDRKPRAVAIATLRTARREDEARGARSLRTMHQLSPSEAALAEKLSRGMTIAEAGRDLHLTEETARNYSKRIYARTGARGQADLVRIVLSGLAPLA